MKFFLFFVASALVVLQAEARSFSRCELVRELRKHGFPEHQLRDWVCLIEKESARRTDAIGSLNTDGSKDWGLFQINDRYWCSATGSPGKECHIRCSDLLLDNIRIASQCAKKIFGVHGFSAWVAWKAHCQGGLPDISRC